MLHGYTLQDEESHTAEQRGADVVIQQRTCATLYPQSHQQPSRKPQDRKLDTYLGSSLSQGSAVRQVVSSSKPHRDNRGQALPNFMKKVECV